MSNGCQYLYDYSNIKNIIDNWSIKYNNDLTYVEGYKARLITNNEAVNSLKYKKVDSTTYIIDNNTYEWAYIDDKSYWATMSFTTGYKMSIFRVSDSITNENVYNKLYIRPVINLKKCALNGTC